MEKAPRHIQKEVQQEREKTEDTSSRDQGGGRSDDVGVDDDVGRPLGATPPAPYEPAPGSLEMPSIGSHGHSAGACKPCAFVHTKGCDNGAMCLFCHLCGRGEKKRRQKATKAAYAEGQQADQTAAATASSSYGGAYPPQVPGQEAFSESGIQEGDYLLSLMEHLLHSGAGSSEVEPHKSGPSSPSTLTGFVLRANRDAEGEEPMLERIQCVERQVAELLDRISRLEKQMAVPLAEERSQEAYEWHAESEKDRRYDTADAADKLKDSQWSIDQPWNQADSTDTLKDSHQENEEHEDLWDKWKQRDPDWQNEQDQDQDTKDTWTQRDSASSSRERQNNQQWNQRHSSHWQNDQKQNQRGSTHSDRKWQNDRQWNQRSSAPHSREWHSQQWDQKDSGQDNRTWKSQQWDQKDSAQDSGNWNYQADTAHGHRDQHVASYHKIGHKQLS